MSKEVSQKLAGPNNKGATPGPCTLQHFLPWVRALSNRVTGIWCVACGVPHAHQLLEVSLNQAQSIVHSVWMFALSCIGVCVLRFYAVYSCTLYPAHCSFLPFAFMLVLCSLAGQFTAFLALNHTLLGLLLLHVISTRCWQSASACLST